LQFFLVKKTAPQGAVFFGDMPPVLAQTSPVSVWLLNLLH
jgi:hypothetical protein